MNRWVLVTGCSSGIGKAAAVGLQTAGYQVIAWTRTQEQAMQLEREGLHAMGVDNESPEQIRAGWSRVLEKTQGSRVWAVFANAGYGQPGAAEDVPAEALEKQLRTNVVGTHELLRLAVRDMRKWGGGRLVVCSSVLGVVGLKQRSAYVCSKYALEGLADVMRLELKGSGIDVSLLEPGPVLTRFRQNGLVMFERYIDEANSVHSAAYKRLKERLAHEGPVTRFTAMPEACVPLLRHAFESRRPKARYRWTVQTKLFSFLKRILPTSTMDAIARRG